MKRYVIIHPDGSTSTVVQQPGAIRKVWRWYWSIVVYLIAWALIWAQPVFVVVMVVVSMIAERGIPIVTRTFPTIGGQGHWPPGSLFKGALRKRETGARQ